MSSDQAYEGSDESSENELLDKSLSVWRGGWTAVDREDFAPVSLDLHTACSIGHYDTVRAFINGKEDINRKNVGGWTPLMYGCYIGHDNIVNLLLEAGVDVNCQNPKGQTPLMLAASCGNESVGYFLCQQGAELEVRDDTGWTALFHATYSGHQNMVKFLLDQGSNMNAIEPKLGITPFMEAAAEGNEIILQLFLQLGVNVNAKTNKGHTARSLGLKKGHLKIVSLIDNHTSSTPIRAEPGLFTELSSSGNRQKGPSIRDGPEGFARYLDRSRCPDPNDPPANSYIPTGYMTFKSPLETDNEVAVQIRSRDVTSPISANDHSLESSTGKDSLDNDEDWNSFSKTGALTIKSNSSSSGGLASALGISRENSLESNEEISSALLGELTSTEQSTLPGMRTPADGAYGQDDVTALSVPDSKPNIKQDTNQNTHPYSPWTGTQPFSLFSQNENQPSTIMLSQSDNIVAVDNFSRAVNNVIGDMLSLQLEAPVSNNPPICDKPCFKESQSVMRKENRPTPERCLSSRGLPNAPLSAHTSRPLSALPSSEPTHPPMNLVGQPMVPNALFERPCDLPTLLDQIGMSQYKKTFLQQDVDLQVFLSLTENDLKEIGVKLFGHRRKMTIAIARWHSKAQLYMDNLEQVYANKLEAEMQEMAIQLQKIYEENTRLKAQVLQEKELRSVTESCLMEERSSWQHTQHLLRETRQCCHDLTAEFGKLRYQQSEVKRRSLPDRLLWEDATNPDPNHHDNQSSSPQTADNTPPSFDDLYWKIDCYLKHLERNIIVIKHNTDKLYSPQQRTLPMASELVQ